MEIYYSIIIPVYNRPEEIDELLESLIHQTYTEDYEVVIVEDGSTIDAKSVIAKYSDQLNITYHYKSNSGPGDSRNFGMRNAAGNYFIILDSDCILPKEYLANADIALQADYVACFGGPDNAHDSFSDVQKAINYAMTSMLTTGGLRGNKNLKSKFQPRSFNMGLSKEAFRETKGFNAQRFGEDIDLTFRLWRANFDSQFIENAFVFHKRRTDWQSFYRQVFNFGAARPILNKLYPSTAKITYWFPSFFIIGLFISITLFFMDFEWLLACFGFYSILIICDSLIRNKSLIVAILSLLASLLQFCGYGLGFLRSFFRLNILRKSTTESFPRMFS